MSDKTPFYPDNDKILQFRFKILNPTTGRSTPATTGAGTAFFATSGEPDAEPADPALEIALVHIGRGKWIASFDAVDHLALDIVDPIFGQSAGDPAFVIATHSSGIRVSEEMEYIRRRPATS